VYSREDIGKAMAYKAPELLKKMAIMESATQLDKPADVYALGVLIFEVVSSRILSLAMARAQCYTRCLQGSSPPF
jgi:serine/threonine protein kinase